MHSSLQVGRFIDILLVEDSPGDVRLARETLRDYRMQNALHVVKDGDEALSYLRQEPPFENVPRPDLVLLDLNLPKVDGTEVLQAMRNDPTLASIPVVILTTSKVQEDLLRRFDLPVECFITKPLAVDRYLEAVRCFPHLGVSIVTIATA